EIDANLLISRYRCVLPSVFKVQDTLRRFWIALHFWRRHANIITLHTTPPGKRCAANCRPRLDTFIPEIGQRQSKPFSPMRQKFSPGHHGRDTDRQHEAVDAGVFFPAVLWARRPG